MVALIKPQFEAGKELVGKNGVVRDKSVHEKTILDVVHAVTMLGATPKGLTYSPIKGPEGNIEYLMFVQKSTEPAVLDDSAVEQVVAASHSTLDR